MSFTVQDTAQDMFWPIMTELGYTELLWESIQSQIRNQILAAMY